MTQTQTQYAGFWIRFVAAIIDQIVLQVTTYVLQLALMGAGFWIGRLSGASGSWTEFDLSFDSIGMQIANFILYLTLATPYFVIGHAKYRTTLGKRLLKIYVVDYKTFNTMSWGQSWGRFFASGLSYVPLLGGYIMAAFNSEKRALHDLIAGTVSVTYSASPVERIP